MFNESFFSFLEVFEVSQILYGTFYMLTLFLTAIANSFSDTIAPNIAKKIQMILN